MLNYGLFGQAVDRASGPAPMDQALMRLQQRQAEADRLRMAQMAAIPQQRRMSLLEGVLGLLGNAFAPQQMAGTQFMQGIQGGIQNEHQQDMQGYDILNRQAELQARGLERQGEFGLKRAELQQDAFGNARKEALQRDAMRADQQRFEQEDATRRYGIDKTAEGKLDANQLKEKLEHEKTLKDPKSTRAARENAMAILEAFGREFSPDLKQQFLESTYYEDNKVADTGLKTAKTETENKMRQVNYDNAVKKGDLMTAQKESTNAQRDYRKKVTEWIDRDMGSKINERQARVNIAKKRLEHLISLGSSITPAQALALDSDISALDADLAGLVIEQQLLMKQLNEMDQTSDDSTTKKRVFDLKDAIDANLVQQRENKRKLQAAKELKAKAPTRPTIDVTGQMSGPIGGRIGPVRIGSGAIAGANAGSSGAKPKTTKKGSNTPPPGFRWK